MVLVAVCLIMLLALTALAIDVGIAYAIKAKLNSAVDGAAIAAGRGVKYGISISERKLNGEEAARRYFAANFPADYMGSVLVSGTPEIVIPDPENGIWKITVNGRAQSPLFFGSALNNFGVAEFLDEFVQLAPAPHARPLAGAETQDHTSRNGKYS